MDTLHALTTTEGADSEAANKPCYLFWYIHETSVVRAWKSERMKGLLTT